MAAIQQRIWASNGQLKNTRVIQALHLALDTSLIEAPDIEGFDNSMFAGKFYYQTIFESDSLIKKLIVQEHEVNDFTYFMNMEERPFLLDSSYVTIDLTSGLPIEVNSKRIVTLGNRTKEIRIFIKTAPNKE